MNSRVLLLLWSLVVLAVASVFVVDTSRPSFVLEPVRTLDGPYFASDLEVRGIDELVGIELTDSDSSFSAVHRKGADGLTKKSIVIRGRPVDLTRIEGSQVGEPRFAMFTRRGDSLFSTLIRAVEGSLESSKRQLLYVRDDCRMDGASFPWEPRVQSALRLTNDSGLDAGTLLIGTAGRTGAPRGFLWLDAEGIPDGRIEIGAQIGSLAVTSDQSTLFAGTWTPDNGCLRGGLSDTTSQILVLNVRERRLEAPIQASPEVGSSATVLLTATNSGEKLSASITQDGGSVGGIYEVANRRVGGLVSPDVDGWRMIAKMPWRDDATDVIVAVNQAGRLATIGMETDLALDFGGEVRGIGSAGDLDDDGWPELWVASSSGTEFLDRQGSTVASIPAKASQWEEVRSLDRDPVLIGRDLDAMRTTIYVVARQPVISTLELGRLILLLLLVALSTWGYHHILVRRRLDVESADLREIRDLTQEQLIDEGTSLVKDLPAVMSNRFGDPNLGIPELVEAAGFTSQAELGRVLKKLTGLTPREFVEEYRMARARDLLKEGTHTIEAIAQMVGFRSAGYFATRFRRAHGVSPSEFSPDKA
ncbi:MAG: helix-turn-helix transcriptional regulator [Rhodothermales bacterium]|nr:helix-turn-helix transcriptional regulator [Rhodothermales bacterium]